MKKAFIAVSNIGFVSFIMSDIEILQKMGYQVFLSAYDGLDELRAGLAKNMGNAEGDKEIVLRSREKQIQSFAEKNITYVSVPLDSKKPNSAKNRRAFQIYRNLIRKEKFDIIHAHTPIVGLWLRLAAFLEKKRGAKVFYTTHGLSYTSISPIKERMKFKTVETFLSLFTDAMITINEEDYNEAKKMFCRKVFHINGVGLNIERYNHFEYEGTLYREKIGIPQDKIMILAAGELSARKNHKIVVHALSKLEDKSRYVFVICGRAVTGGKTREEIVRLAEKKNVDVRLLGFRTDMPEIFHCSDFGVIPSLREGLGMSGLQSLCAGKPLIGSNVQGIKEYVIDGETGYLCDPQSATEIAEKIKLLSDPEVRRKMAINMPRVVEKFSKEISEAQRKAIYLEIAS